MLNQIQLSSNRRFRCLDQTSESVLTSLVTHLIDLQLTMKYDKLKLLFSLCCVFCVFQASLSIWGWGGLGVVLFLVTFGPFAIFYLAFYIFCFIVG